jgi:O-antigen/teichoic acid export membrane protein
MLRELFHGPFLKIRYNVLAAIQIGIGLASTLLFIRLFGVSDETDAYFIATSAVLSLNLLQLLAVEQFIYFYTDAKARGHEYVERFFNSASSLAIACGIISGLIFYILRIPICRLFASGFAPEKLAQVVHYFQLLVLSTAVYPVSFINDSLINAEGKYSAVYLIGIFVGLANVAACVGMLVLGKPDLMTLVLVQVGGGLLAGGVRFPLAVLRCASPVMFIISFSPR